MSEPLVSVVIASVNGLPAIAECLEHLTHQEGNVSAEILVLDRCGEETRAVLRARFPSVQVIAAEPTATIPALRARGMARARGRMVAILEDHCNAPPHWISVIERAHRAGHRAVGGAVENGSPGRLVDWAVFFCEYARFMPPVPRGAVAEITGNNSAYDRSLIAGLGADLGGEVWESFLHEKLRAQGVPFYSDPDLVVSHKKEFGFAYFLSQRYHYSRSFAGMRMQGAPPWKRALYAVATPFLPLLLLWRMATTVAHKRRHVGRFLASLPLVGVFLLSWAWGEGVGALFGPGRSLERVE